MPDEFPELLDRLRGLEILAASHSHALATQLTQRAQDGAALADLTAAMKPEARFAPLEEHLRTLENLVRSLSDTIEAVCARVGAMTAGVTDLQARATGVVQTQVGQVAAETERIHDELAGLAEAIPELLREKLEAVQAALAETGEQVVDRTEEVWREGVEEAARAFKERLEALAEQQLDQFKSAAEAAQEKIEQALASLASHVLDDLRELLEKEGEELLTDAVSRLEQEAANAVVTSQLQVQLTATISPILPQLAAVRVAAEGINALAILRMGVI